MHIVLDTAEYTVLYIVLWVVLYTKTDSLNRVGKHIFLSTLTFWGYIFDKEDTYISIIKNWDINVQITNLARFGKIGKML